MQPHPIDQIQRCLSLVSDLSRHPEATQSFVALCNQLTIDQPIDPNLLDELLRLLWDEVLSARRSARFWEQISDVERQISEDMAASHLQLQQNYLRLLQEQ